MTYAIGYAIEPIPTPGATQDTPLPAILPTYAPRCAAHGMEARMAHAQRSTLGARTQ